MTNFVLHKKQPISRQNEKKLLYKIHVAISDITAALRVCKFIESSINSINDEAYYPLFAAVIICYSRPFSRNKPLGPLPDGWTHYNSQEFQDVHDRLIQARNELVAHSDINARKVKIVPHNSLHLKDKGKVISNTGIGIGSSYYLFHPDLFKLVQKMILDLGQRLDEQQIALLAKLYGNMDLPNAPFYLRFDNGL